MHKYWDFALQNVSKANRPALKSTKIHFKNENTSWRVQGKSRTPQTSQTSLRLFCKIHSFLLHLGGTYNHYIYILLIMYVQSGVSDPVYASQKKHKRHLRRLRRFQWRSFRGGYLFTNFNTRLERSSLTLRGNCRTFAMSIRNDMALAEKMLGEADYSPWRRSQKCRERENRI